MQRDRVGRRKPKRCPGTLTNQEVPLTLPESQRGCGRPTKCVFVSRTGCSGDSVTGGGSARTLGRAGKWEGHVSSAPVAPCVCAGMATPTPEGPPWRDPPPEVSPLETQLSALLARDYVDVSQEEAIASNLAYVLGMRIRGWHGDLPLDSIVAALGAGLRGKAVPDWATETSGSAPQAKADAEHGVSRCPVCNQTYPVVPAR